MNRSTLRIAIAVLTVATALVHLFISVWDVNESKVSFQPMFLLNGLGYLALLWALLKTMPVPFLEGKEKLAHYTFVGYTLVTILGWAAIGDKGFEGITPRVILGYADKLIEILLILALWLHLRQTAQIA